MLELEEKKKNYNSLFGFTLILNSYYWVRCLLPQTQIKNQKENKIKTELVDVATAPSYLTNQKKGTQKKIKKGQWFTEFNTAIIRIVSYFIM